MTRAMLYLFSLATALIFLLSSSFVVHGESLKESERRQEYAKRNYTWPLKDDEYIPQTYGWKELWKNRFQQIAQIKDKDERYTGYIQAVTSAFVVPNYTQYGFGLTRCTDKELMDELRQAITDGLPTAGNEPRDITIQGPYAPWLIRRQDLANKVNYKLHSYAEEWAGIKLVPSAAYGLRLYRNESQLYMHLDKPQTHVVSFILHIGSSDDARPWPLLIEDFHGRTHAVTLTPGDLLFYESSKLPHGRPIPFNGTWYCSLFVHYYPADPEFSKRRVDMESHYAVPPIWSEQQPKTFNVPSFEMADVGLTEPDCPNEWCSTQITYDWGGPAQDNELIVPKLNDVVADDDSSSILPTACIDFHVDCPYWANKEEQDECTKNPDYMNLSCRKSCGICIDNNAADRQVTEFIRQPFYPKSKIDDDTKTTTTTTTTANEEL